MKVGELAHGGHLRGGIIREEKIKLFSDHPDCEGLYARPLEGTIRKIKDDSIVGWKETHGYWFLRTNGKRVGRARLMYLFAYGRYPEPTVDHIKHGFENRSNDCLYNLREASFKVNTRNCAAQSNTGYKYISWVAKRRCYFVVDVKFIGRFKTIHQALAARKEHVEPKYLINVDCPIYADLSQYPAGKVRSSTGYRYITWEKNLYRLRNKNVNIRFSTIQEAILTRNNKIENQNWEKVDNPIYENLSDYPIGRPNVRRRRAI